MSKIIISNESEMSKWFMFNYKKLGYSKIIKSDDGTYPDFIMLKDGKKVRVELETKSSRFISHNHDIDKVDEIVCIINDVKLNKPTIAINELFFAPKERITITLDNDLLKWIDKEIKEKNYANRSSAFESFISKTMKRKKLLEELRILDN